MNVKIVKLVWPPPGYDRPSEADSPSDFQVKLYRNVTAELDYYRAAINALIERANNE